MKAHFNTYTDNQGKAHRFKLPEGCYLKKVEITLKGDLRWWQNEGPVVAGTSKGYEHYAGDTVEKHLVGFWYRPSKKRAKKAKKTPKSSPKYTILKPEDVIQEGDVWDGTKGCKNVLCDKSFFGSNVAGLKQSFPWRVYKRPPVKNPMSGSRVAFDLSTLPELIGEGTILDRQLGDNDDWLVWLDKPVLGQNVLTIPKKFFKVK
jgi:hypothetical protein